MSTGFYKPNRGRGPILEDRVIAEWRGLSAYAVVLIIHLWTRWNRRNGYLSDNGHLAVDYDALLAMCDMSRRHARRALE